MATLVNSCLSCVNARLTSLMEIAKHPLLVKELGSNLLGLPAIKAFNLANRHDKTANPPVVFVYSDVTSCIAQLLYDVSMVYIVETC